jgi:5-carboxymethyl-2-hydroxymuconate isomerase
MPHCIVEYSANLAEEARIPVLLQTLADHYRSAPDVFPLAGIRVRALPVTDVVIADGNPEHGFVNVTWKIGAGRDEAFLKDFFARAFDLVQTHLAPLSRSRGIGLTQYVEIAPPAWSWKSNSIRNFLGNP